MSANESPERPEAVVEELRTRISACDRELLEALNRRLEIVRALHDHKQAHAIPLRDPGREAALVAALAEENPGPLSSAGLRAFFESVIELTRRELHGG